MDHFEVKSVLFNPQSANVKIKWPIYSKEDLSVTEDAFHVSLNDMQQQQQDKEFPWGKKDDCAFLGHKVNSSVGHCFIPQKASMSPPYTYTHNRS